MSTVPPTQHATLMRPREALDRFFDEIEAVVPGVLHAVVQMCLWDSIEDFCTRSTFWRQTVQWTLGAGVNMLDFNPFDGASLIVQVLELEGLSQWEMQPVAVLVDHGDSTLQRQGHALVALKPVRLSNQIPGFLTDLWFEPLRDGALSRLYGQPAKPYSNMQLAQFFGRRFEVGISRARGRAAHMNSRHAPTWRFPYFARGRRKV